MSITPPTGILDITDAIVRVSKLEFRGATGFDTILNNVARNTALLVDQNVEYTTDKAWGLKLPNAWVSEFDAYWASGASGNIDFNIYNNTTSGTNGYVISMDDTTITVTYDGGSALETVSLGSTLRNDTWRKIHILFERDMISLAIDGTPVLYFKDTLLRPRVYDEESGYVIASGLSADRKVKNLRILNGDKWMTDNTSNIAFVHGNVGIGTTQAAYTLDVKGDVRATGNLLIEGLTTTVDTQNLSIEDAIVEIGRGNDGGTSGKDVGFLFTRNNGADTTNSNVALVYDESTDRLTFGYSDGSPTDSTLAINTSKSLSVVIPSGNLGIGTASPSHKLHIKAVSGDAEIHIQAQGNAGDSIIYFNGAATNQRKCAIISSNVAPGSWCKQDLHFCHNTSENYDDVTIADSKMVITNAGNVGIGTTNPQAQLHITSGTSGDCVLRMEADTDNNNEVDNPRIEFITDGGLATALVGAGQLPFSSANDNALVLAALQTIFYTGVQNFNDDDQMLERMRIDSSGNVGIATASPKQMFEVDSSGYGLFSGRLGVGNVLTSAQNGGGQNHWDDGTSAKLIVRCANNANKDATYANARAYAGIALVPGFDAYDTTNMGLWGTGSGENPVFYIQNQVNSGANGGGTISLQPVGGNVGIGTTNPGTKLQVNGNISSYKGSYTTNNSTWTSVRTLANGETSLVAWQSTTDQAQMYGLAVIQWFGGSTSATFYTVYQSRSELNMSATTLQLKTTNAFDTTINVSVLRML